MAQLNAHQERYGQPASFSADSDAYISLDKDDLTLSKPGKRFALYSPAENSSYAILNYSSLYAVASAGISSQGDGKQDIVSQGQERSEDQPLPKTPTPVPVLSAEQ